MSIKTRNCLSRATTFFQHCNGKPHAMPRVPFNLSYVVSVSAISLSLAISPVAHAQTVDGFEFGKISAMTVRIATQIDHLNRRCKGDTVPIFINQTDFVLGQIEGRSSKRLVANSAKVLGVTPEKVRDLAIEEANEALTKFGGCKSKAFRTLMNDLVGRFGEYQRYLADVADLVRRNPGQNIIR